jgi:hypothetical protein
LANGIWKIVLNGYAALLPLPPLAVRLAVVVGQTILNAAPINGRLRRNNNGAWFVLRQR